MKGLLPSEQWTLFDIQRLPWAAREKACACIGDESHVEKQPGLTSLLLMQGGSCTNPPGAVRHLRLGRDAY